MTSLSSLGGNERSARTFLSLVAAPNDPSTGRLVDRVGAVELLRLADADSAVPGLDQIAAAVWRERLHTVSSADSLATQMATFERQGLRVLIPGEKDWPVALNDLGARTPYALWTRGETTLLAKPLADRYWYAAVFVLAVFRDPRLREDEPGTYALTLFALLASIYRSIRLSRVVIV